MSSVIQKVSPVFIERMRKAIQSCVAEGVYPSVKDVCVRMGRKSVDLGKSERETYKNILSELDIKPAAFQKWSIAEAIEDCVREGVYPSSRTLCDRMGRKSHKLGSPELKVRREILNQMGIDPRRRVVVTNDKQKGARSLRNGGWVAEVGLPNQVTYDRRMDLKRGSVLHMLEEEWVHGKPHRYRALAQLQLLSLGGWTIEQVAEAFGTRTDVVSKTINDAVESIRKEFSVDYISFKVE